MGKPAIIKKISVVDTLKSIGVNQHLEIKNKYIKASLVRTAVSRLNKEGYSYSCSEAGRVDSVLVTRIK